MTDFDLVTNDLLCYPDRTAVSVHRNADGTVTLSSLSSGKRRTVSSMDWEQYLNYALMGGAWLEPGLPWEAEDVYSHRGQSIGIMAR